MNAVNGIHHSYVIGLFASEVDACNAIEALHAQGFTHRNIELVNQAHIGNVLAPELRDPEEPAVAADKDIGDARIMAGSPTGLVDPASYLAHLGVPQEDTSFYAEAIRLGGALLLVSVSGEQVQTVRRTIQEANAMSLAGNN